MSNLLHSLFNVIEIVTQEIEHVGDDVCSEPGVMKALRLVGYLILLMKYLVPVIIIVWGSFDIYKAVFQGTPDELKKQAKVLLVRVFLALCIFLLPGAINIVITAIHEEADDNSMCATCLLDPMNCDT